jgi:hypothetical protein
MEAPKTAKPVTLWHYAAVLVVIICGALTVMMVMRAAGGPTAEDTEEVRSYATTDQEAAAKDYILNTMKYRDAVTVLLFGPNDSQGKLGMTWPRPGDKKNTGTPVPVSVVRVRWTYIKMDHFSRVFDFLYYLHDGKVLGYEVNAWGNDWKKNLRPTSNRLEDPPGFKDVQ